MACIHSKPHSRQTRWILRERGGSIDRQDLLAETGLSERTVDRAVDRFEELGVVRREWVLTDLRYVRIVLVEEGTNSGGVPK